MSEQPSDQRRLEEQRDDLRLLNQVMRHDIRNDLQLIGAYAEMLDDHVDEAGSEYLRIIKESTESAANLTTTARDLAQVLLSSNGQTDAVSLDGALNQQLDEPRSRYPEAVVHV